MEIWCKFIVFFSILMFFLHSSSITAQEVEDEHEFDYKDESDKGPAQWGHIKKEWETCNSGSQQSPIDLRSKRVKVIPKVGEIQKNYKPCNATIKNRGHDICVYWYGNPGSVKINGVVYNLKQAHWHSPSEHSINGKRHALELHMVHMAADPKAKRQIAVIGQLYKVGKPDPFLTKLSKEIKGIVGDTYQKTVGVVNPADIRFGGTMFYRYTGSLTVPPCTEGVIWTMNRLIRTASAGQVKLLRDSVHDYAEFNARPVQKINRRSINLYNPKSIS